MYQSLLKTMSKGDIEKEIEKLSNYKDSNEYAKLIFALRALKLK